MRKLFLLTIMMVQTILIFAQSETGVQSDPLGLCPDGNHPHAIDMGGGILWACCNVGASSPAEYGSYFAWGETKIKDYCNLRNYKWCKRKRKNYLLTKYCTSSYKGIVDNRTQLELSDDAAWINWGAPWRIPVVNEIWDLFDNCTWTWTTIGDVKGRLVTAPNGNRIFLPAAGFSGDMGPAGIDWFGSYWSSLLVPDYPDYARELHFDGHELSANNGGVRENGNSVRPVRMK